MVKTTNQLYMYIYTTNWSAIHRPVGEVHLQEFHPAKSVPTRPEARKMIFPIAALKNQRVYIYIYIFVAPPKT